MNCEDYEYPYPCDSDDFNECVLTVHEILNDATWYNMIDGFLVGNARRDGFSVDLGTLEIPDDCNGYLMRVIFDPTDYTNSHFDIDFVTWTAPPPSPQDGTTYWSIFVLRGIAGPGRNAVSFKLFKLKESKSGIIAAGMIAFDNTGNPVFRGDITSELPLIPGIHKAQLP